jgi:hypothetical protein
MKGAPRQRERKSNKKSNADKHEDNRDIKDAKNGALTTTHEFDKPKPNHERIEQERPAPKPTFYQKNEGFTPSRSYLKKKEED